MENRKQRLINSLSLAIVELKNNTIHYDWRHQESCNCGVVAQAVLGTTPAKVRELWLEASGKLRIIESIKPDEEPFDRTWQNAVKNLCPMTGEPMVKVFKMLFDAGLTKSDIVHLEYMDNPAILKRSGINIKEKVSFKSSKKVMESKTIMVKHPFYLLRILGVMQTKEVQVEVVEYVDKKTGYYASRNNLVLYLTAWVSILKEGTKYKESDTLSEVAATDLEHELLVAVANEDFEYAAALRDKINVK